MFFWNLYNLFLLRNFIELFWNYYKCVWSKCPPKSKNYKETEQICTKMANIGQKSVSTPIKPHILITQQNNFIQLDSRNSSELRGMKVKQKGNSIPQAISVVFSWFFKFLIVSFTPNHLKQSWNCTSPESLCCYPSPRSRNVLPLTKNQKSMKLPKIS